MTPLHRPDFAGDFVALGPARFVMGAAADDRYATELELPRRIVTLERRFAIGIFPVTEVQWNFLTGSALPKTDVSLTDIAHWLETARGKCDLPLRLPSEEEWEFAARAGCEGGFPHGETIGPDEANFLHDDGKNRVGPGARTPRGTYPPNAFGLEDMLGNVAEWTCDGIVRSAGWDALPRLLRLSARYQLPPDRRQDNLGFRLAFDLP